MCKFEIKLSLLGTPRNCKSSQNLANFLSTNMWDMQYRDKSLNMLAQELSKIEELLDNQIKDSEKGKSIDKIWFLFSLYIGHHSEEDLDQFEFLKDYISKY